MVERDGEMTNPKNMLSYKTYIPADSLGEGRGRMLFDEVDTKLDGYSAIFLFGVGAGNC